MLLQKKREQATYGIIGLGRFGHALAVELANSRRGITRNRQG